MPLTPPHPPRLPLTFLGFASLGGDSQQQQCQEEEEAPGLHPAWGRRDGGDGGDPVPHGPAVLSGSHPAPSTKERRGQSLWLPWCLTPAPKESRDGRNNPSKSSPLPWGGRGAEPADLTHKCTQRASSPERFSRSAAPTAGSTPIGTSPENQACAPGVCMSVCVCVCVHNGRASPSWQQPRGLGDRCLLESGARVRQAPAPSPPCARRWLCSEWSCQGGLHSPAG